MPYSILVITENASLSRKIQKYLAPVADEFNVVGKADNAVTGKTFMDELQPQIIIAQEDMGFWNIRNLIKETADSEPTQYILLTDEKGIKQSYMGNTVSSAVNRHDLNATLLIGAVSKAANHWDEKSKEFSHRQAEYMPFTAIADGRPLLAELLSGVVLDDDDMHVSDGHLKVRSLDPDAATWMMIASIQVDSPFSFYYYLSRMPSFFKQLYILLDVYGKGHLSVLDEHNLCIILPGFKTFSAEEWTELANNINQLAGQLNLPEFVFSLSETPILPDGWRSCRKALISMQRYRYFTNEQLILRQSWLSENSVSVTHDVIEKSLNAIIKSTHSLNETALYKSGTEIKELIRRALSFDILGFFWNQLIFQHSIIIQAYNLSPDDYPIVSSWQDHKDLDEAFHSAMNMYARLMGGIRECKETESDTVSRALAYMRLHIYEQVKLSQVAEAVFVSPSYLSRKIKKETSYSFVDNMNMLRIEEAKKLLAQNLKVGDVCYSTGFENSKYFSQVFKKHVGITPQLYRKQSIETGVRTNESNRNG